eukprot:Rmarinus@m.9294
MRIFYIFSLNLLCFFCVASSCFIPELYVNNETLSSSVLHVSIGGPPSKATFTLQGVSTHAKVEKEVSLPDTLIFTLPLMLQLGGARISVLPDGCGAEYTASVDLRLLPWRANETGDVDIDPVPVPIREHGAPTVLAVCSPSWPSMFPGETGWYGCLLTAARQEHPNLEIAAVLRPHESLPVGDEFGFLSYGAHVISAGDSHQSFSKCWLRTAYLMFPSDFVVHVTDSFRTRTIISDVIDVMGQHSAAFVVEPCPERGVRVLVLNADAALLVLKSAPCESPAVQISVLRSEGFRGIYLMPADVSFSVNQEILAALDLPVVSIEGKSYLNQSAFETDSSVGVLRHFAASDVPRCLQYVLPVDSLVSSARTPLNEVLFSAIANMCSPIKYIRWMTNVEEIKMVGELDVKNADVCADMRLIQLGKYDAEFIVHVALEMSKHDRSASAPVVALALFHHYRSLRKSNIGSQTVFSTLLADALGGEACHEHVRSVVASNGITLVESHVEAMLLSERAGELSRRMSNQLLGLSPYTPSQPVSSLWQTWHVRSFKRDDADDIPTIWPMNISYEIQDLGYGKWVKSSEVRGDAKESTSLDAESMEYVWLLDGRPVQQTLDLDALKQAVSKTGRDVWIHFFGDSRTRNFFYYIAGKFVGDTWTENIIERGILPNRVSNPRETSCWSRVCAMGGAAKLNLTFEECVTIFHNKNAKMKDDLILDSPEYTASLPKFRRYMNEISCMMTFPVGEHKLRLTFDWMRTYSGFSDVDQGYEHRLFANPNFKPDLLIAGPAHDVDVYMTHWQETKGTPPILASEMMMEKLSKFLKYLSLWHCKMSPRTKIMLFDAPVYDLLDDSAGMFALISQLFKTASWMDQCHASSRGIPGEVVDGVGYSTTPQNLERITEYYGRWFLPTPLSAYNRAALMSGAEIFKDARHVKTHLYAGLVFNRVFSYLAEHGFD